MFIIGQWFMLADGGQRRLPTARYPRIEGARVFHSRRSAICLLRSPSLCVMLSPPPAGEESKLAQSLP